MAEEIESFSEVFAKAIDEWRKKHRLREDDPLLLCLELFRIHQDHWDAIRRKELPSFSEFRDSLMKLQQQLNALMRHGTVLLEELRRCPRPAPFIEPTLIGFIFTALFSSAAGILIGKFLL